MSIILENQCVKADVCLDGGLLNIEFADDPSFIRGEAVLVDLVSQTIGIIFQNAYHHIGDLPENLTGQNIEALVRARLCGHGEGGKPLSLHAPVKIIATHATRQ